MKIFLLILFSSFLFNTFEPIGISEDDEIEAMVYVKGEKVMLFLETNYTEPIDSLIINTDIWRIALARVSYTDENIFNINTAEAIVLRKDLVKSYEIRVAGKGNHFLPTDAAFIRKKLAK